jgi:hypothetical protein
MQQICSKYAQLRFDDLAGSTAEQAKTGGIIRALLRLTEMELLNPASCQMWPHLRWVYRLHSQQLGW